MLGGLLFVTGILIMAVNWFMTWTTRPPTYEVPVYHTPRLSKEAPEETIDTTSALDDVPVLESAKKLDVFGKMDWHRRWERLPVRFTVLTTLAVVIASLFEIIPTFLIRSNVPTIATVKPYTPLELAGRDIFVAEGCYNCHSQMVRPFVAETKRYGEYSKAGEFIYDRPFQWGSRRIGPDLAREGGKQSSLWHWLHLENPEQVSPGSVMPSYVHLLDTKINFEMIPERVWAAQAMGAPYDFDIADSADIARKQAEVIAADVVSQGGPVQRGELMTFDTKAIALIAFLQRVGTDIFATPEAEPTEETPGDPAAAEEPETEEVAAR
ncbi:Cytochrome C oxidase, monohem subunit/FixO [Rhodopirellula maiorica SM1]|uniref:Cytochrome C oxidase, monohem subunit/FixO n=1 Tax=Rhodopirellula maiorica SM1 TaxID=1265738 RepID=M5RF06_9BACT|nr:Cytochrome C oxidase, monohem subunit/FixO [Rhodopirellula maiorica SM1]